MAWQQCGRADGYPVLVLHGGPGGSAQAYYRQLLDPTRVRGILYDQRGCGASRPLGELEGNDTPALVEDIEHLRRHLGIDRWLVLGGSWGSTLALAYGQAFPDSVAGLVLTGVFLARDQDREWFWQGARRVYPDAWRTMQRHLPAAEQSKLRHHYLRRVLSDDPAIAGPAGVALMLYECSLLNPEPDARFLAGVAADTEGTARMARLFCHYDSNRAFLAENQLLDNAHRLASIPGHILNGRLDMCTPSGGAMDLAEAWPDARLTIVERAGHRWNDPYLAPAVIAALAELLGELSQGNSY
jgi:proline iminopeptidase